MATTTTAGISGPGGGASTTRSAAEIIGARLLKEVDDESCTLEELLISLRLAQNQIQARRSAQAATAVPATTYAGAEQPAVNHAPSRIDTSTSTSLTGIPALDRLWAAHGPGPLLISGRGAPLIHQIIEHGVGGDPDTGRGGTVAVLDLEGRFEASHLRLSDDELRHVYVFQPPAADRGEEEEEEAGNGTGEAAEPPRPDVKSLMRGVERFMLWGLHRSMDRAWGITIVLGGVSAGPRDVCLHWRGWLSVERVEEQQSRRSAPEGSEGEPSSSRRHTIGKRRTVWRAESAMGGFTFARGE